MTRAPLGHEMKKILKHFCITLLCGLAVFGVFFACFLHTLTYSARQPPEGIHVTTLAVAKFVKGWVFYRPMYLLAGLSQQRFADLQFPLTIFVSFVYGGCLYSMALFGIRKFWHTADHKDGTAGEQ